MADVKVTIAANNQGLKDGLEKARKNVRKFKEETDGAITGLGGKLTRMFSLGAIAAAARSFISTGKEIRETADRLNLTTDAYQGLDKAFRKGGASSEDFEKGVIR